MKRFLLFSLAGTLLAGSASAQQALAVNVQDITAEGTIPQAYALCIPTPDGKSVAGENLRPAIAWTPGPPTTKSYAVVVADPDVPADLGAANQSAPIPPNAPRQIFYHWVQIGIPPTVARLGGSDESIRPRLGTAMANDVNPVMPFNYGGPCPPWNDQRVHHYHFQVLALDVANLILPPGSTRAKDAITAMDGHVLAKGEVVGAYTLNPQLRK